MKLSSEFYVAACFHGMVSYCKPFLSLIRFNHPIKRMAKNGLIWFLLPWQFAIELGCALISHHFISWQILAVNFHII